MSLVEVARFNDVTEAQAAAAALRASGIDAVIQNEAVAQVFGGLPLAAAGVRLLAREADAAAARAFIDEHAGGAKSSR